MSLANNFQEKANLIRKWCLISTTEAKSGHPTSCLSAADIMTVLFDKYFKYDLANPLNLFNDRFVLSKGHAAPLLYSLFAIAGAYPPEELKTLRKFGSRFQGHPTPRFIYTEAATGSLGQGLSVAAGLALVAKREKLPYKAFALLGDGELAEGQVWEAGNFCSFHKLNNLIAILDINRLAQSGQTMFGYDLEKYIERFKGLDFETITIDGHNFYEIDKALEKATTNRTDKPIVIIAKTIKGKGVSFLENKEGWHGKALKKDELQKALYELGNIDDNLRFQLKKPESLSLLREIIIGGQSDFHFEKGMELATREIFGKVITRLAGDNENIYALDGDVKNSTFSEDFLKAFPERFIECYIAEQNMVSVAAGLSRLGKIPFVTTFAAFLTRAFDQIRMARISESNLKFVGSHVGVSIGEDGPSQMGLEDIAMFGTLPDTVILQPADAVSTARLVPLMVNHRGFAYMRTLRSKTPVLYDDDQNFHIGGAHILRQSDEDLLVIAASGITVFEALKAADKLQQEGINICVIDCYSINPIDKDTLEECCRKLEDPIIITVEDHFLHGGLGDFVAEAISGKAIRVFKLGVSHISQSGTEEELLADAGIDATAILNKINEISKHKNPAELYHS
jgi:transketolase